MLLALALLAVAQARSMPDRAKVADVLVHRGLGSDSYQTRIAAHGCLIRMGEGAILACVAGLDSRDAEVRWRCKLILDGFKTGEFVEP